MGYDIDTTTTFDEQPDWLGDAAQANVSYIDLLNEHIHIAGEPTRPAIIVENPSTIHIEGGILKGVEKWDEASGYLGEEGFYVLLSNFRKTNFSQFDGSAQELSLNIEQVITGDEEVDGTKPKYSMLLSLQQQGAQDWEDFATYVEQMEDIFGTFAEIHGFENLPDQELGFAKKDSNLILHLELSRDALKFTVEVIDPVDDLNQLTDHVLPEAVRVFNRAFPENAISPELVCQSAAMACKSDQLSFEQQTD